MSNAQGEDLVIQSWTDGELLELSHQLHHRVVNGGTQGDYLLRINNELLRRMETGEGSSAVGREAARMREETVTIRTTWNYANQLEQMVAAPTGVIQRRVLNTMEKQAREALIAMGWKPPGS